MNFCRSNVVNADNRVYDCSCGKGVCNSDEYILKVVTKLANTIDLVGYIPDKEIKYGLIYSFLLYYAEHIQHRIFITEENISTDDFRKQIQRKINIMLECIKKNSCIIKDAPDICTCNRNADDFHYNGGILEDVYEPCVIKIEEEEPPEVDPKALAVADRITLNYYKIPRNLEELKASSILVSELPDEPALNQGYHIRIGVKEKS